MKDLWLLIDDVSYSPYMNMAIDELLLDVSRDQNKPILRLYGWDRPSVSIGYIQNYSAAPEQGYTVVRRPTGGGVVFHDIDLTYTVIVPSNHWIEKLNRQESYRVFHDAVISALADVGVKSSSVDFDTVQKDRMTMKCFVSPTKYDVVAAGNNSKTEQTKIAGAAQRRTKKGILHQGSIVIDDLSKKLNKLKHSLKESFKTKFDIEYQTLNFDSNFINAASNLAEKKYSTDDWNHIR